MKKLSVIPDITVTFDIFVDPTPEYFQAAMLIGQSSPGLLDDTNILQEWISFVDQFRAKIEADSRLDLIRVKPGKTNPSISTNYPLSQYFYVGIIGPDGNTDETLVIDFRLSTHTSTDDSEDPESARSKGEAKFNQAAGLEADFIRGNFIVNNKTCKSYTQAKFGLWNSLEKSISQYYETVGNYTADK